MLCSHNLSGSAIMQMQHLQACFICQDLERRLNNNSNKYPECPAWCFLNLQKLFLVWSSVISEIQVQPSCPHWISVVILSSVKDVNACHSIWSEFKTVTEQYYVWSTTRLCLLPCFSANCTCAHMDGVLQKHKISCENYAEDMLLHIHYLRWLGFCTTHNLDIKISLA